MIRSCRSQASSRLVWISTQHAVTALQRGASSFLLKFSLVKSPTPPPRLEKGLEAAFEKLGDFSSPLKPFSSSPSSPLEKPPSSPIEKPPLLKPPSSPLSTLQLSALPPRAEGFSSPLREAPPSQVPLRRTMLEHYRIQKRDLVVKIIGVQCSSADCMSSVLQDSSANRRETLSCRSHVAVHHGLSSSLLAATCQKIAVLQARKAFLPSHVHPICRVRRETVLARR